MAFNPLNPLNLTTGVFDPQIRKWLWVYIQERAGFSRKSLLSNISVRKNRLLEQLEAVFPTQYPVTQSRDALTACSDIIAAHDEWFKRLSFFPYGLGLIFFIALVIKIMANLWLDQPILIIPALAIALLEFFLWVYWVKFLKWTEGWGIHPNITTVLGVGIPAGLCLLPKALVCAGKWDGASHWLSRSVIGGSLLLSSLLVALLLAGALASAFNVLVKNQQRWREPRAHLLNSLFCALWRVIPTTNNQHWADPKTREQIVAYLENAAKCLEVIPKAILGRDAFSSRWNRREYFRRASGIRDLKKWALLPKAETRGNLESELRHILQLVATGDWDGFPQADLPADAPIPWSQRTLILIRAVIVASIPLFAVIFFSDRLPDGDFKKYLNGLACVWAVVHLLAAIDPRFSEKLSAFKDLPSFLPFGGKSKDKD
jgi:hypothetical protein